MYSYKWLYLSGLRNSKFIVHTRSYLQEYITCIQEVSMSIEL